MKYNLITVLGATAVGKTKLAVKLAHRFNGEIISADSRQVYKKMDIGTGKDLNDYLIENQKIKYHLIDVIDPEKEFDLFQFKEMFKEVYDEIRKKNKVPFLVGGTGLYLSSIVQNYKLNKADFNSTKQKKYNLLPHSELKDKLIRLNPKLHNTTDLLNKERTVKAILKEESKNEINSDQNNKINSLNIGIKLEREKIKTLITKRLKSRLENGMIEEVDNLISSGITYEKLNFFGLEYKYIAQYLKKELTYNDMFQKLNSAIHSLAKRQMTWFRKMEKEGIKINWIESTDFEGAKKLIKENYFK